VSADDSPGQEVLRSRIRAWTTVFMVGLVLSGLTAIPVHTEMDLVASVLGPDFRGGGYVPPFVSAWLLRAHEGIRSTSERAPFVWYGNDWLAFGHVVLALAFVGALRDPVRNRWLYQFGMLACVLVVPWALVFGAVRGIPWWWRLIDCSFGVFGFIPPWLCHRWTGALERRAA
jgi:hypothetical protein